MSGDCGKALKATVGGCQALNLCLRINIHSLCSACTGLSPVLFHPVLYRSTFLRFHPGLTALPPYHRYASFPQFRICALPLLSKRSLPLLVVLEKSWMQIKTWRSFSTSIDHKYRSPANTGYFPGARLVFVGAVCHRSATSLSNSE